MNYFGALGYWGKLSYPRYKKLRECFQDIQDLWMAETGDIIKAGIEPEIATNFVAWRQKHLVEQMTDELVKLGIQTISIDESLYPPLLSEMADPPVTLFVRGTLPLPTHPTVAVVGTRKCTSYGKQVTEEITEVLATHGVVIVSGLALGIDGVAHSAAIQAAGKTVAVLGSGVDPEHVYPASHRRLAESIIEQGGAILSEYPPGFDPTPYSFPMRNRIIAGLSLGVLVTEAPSESGALITAHVALDYNRDVFAVPHPVTSVNGEGGNNLIRKGALLVRKVEDILEALSIETSSQKKSSSLPSNPTEAKLLEHLSRLPQHIDMLMKASRLDSQAVNSTLTILEMKGMVKNVGGMMYVLV